MLGAGKDAPAWKLAAAGSMGACSPLLLFATILLPYVFPTWMYKAGGIAGFIGNPGGPPCPPFEVVSLIQILELQR